MTSCIKRFSSKEIIQYDLTAYETFKRKCSKHIEAKAATDFISLLVYFAKHISSEVLKELTTHSRAMFTIMLSGGKLFSTFPSVLLPKVRNPAKAIVKQATIEIKVDQCVTRAKRSSVGFFREP